MRHKISGKRLGRDSTHLRATLRDLARAILISQRICTTKIKAKEARRLIEKLITLGKDANLAARRKAFSILCDHKLVSNLFSDIAPRFKSRQGGYTRIIPLGVSRRGDNSPLVYLELTEKKIVLPKPTTGKAKKEARSTEAEKKEAVKAENPPEAKKEHVDMHYEKDLHSKEKPPKMARKPLMGGIKKIFTKKPSE